MKPSGTPHLGNYLGMIRPALALQEAGTESFHLIASYHALTTVRDPDRIRQHTLEAAATFLALGLDPSRSVLYRQQDVPEVTELAWMLECVTSVGMLRRSHAYKAARAELGEDRINAGLFTYPVLMAADILAFDAAHVPVGRDQTQHVELARDVAQRFNGHYGDLLAVPAALVRPEVATVIGTDGRKMSKSYGNTIPIFEPPDRLRQAIAAIRTDPTPLADPKDPDRCTVFALYRALATPEQTADLRARYLAGGFGYGHAKQELVALLDAALAEPRERYAAYLADPAAVTAVLEDGAARARPIAQEVLARVRDAVGL